MDVRLSPEQRALRDSAAQVVDRLGPQAVGQLDDHERVAKLDAAVAAAGWRELRAADDDGRPWASGVEVGIVAEELGRGLADVPFLGPTLAAELRRLAAAPPATSPETVAFTLDLSAIAVAGDHAEGAGRPDGVDGATHAGAAEAPADTGSRRGTGDPGAHDGGDARALLRGAVAIDALSASSALVLIPVAGGHALGQVHVPRAETRIDLTRPSVALGAVADDGAGAGQAIVPAPEQGGVLTDDGAGDELAVVTVAEQGRVLTDDDVSRWTALGLAVACADLVGTMRGAVHLATGYARERRQFSRPIGSFQAVQHLLADALVATEGSRSAALHASWAVDALPPDDALAAAAKAKAYCARAARTVCETAIQVHGGIGNTWECLAHVHLRRALLSTDVLGGVGPSLARVLAHHGISDGMGGQRGLR